MNTDYMNLPAYRPWMNAVLYQAVWFTCILGRENYVYLSLALLSLHLVLCRQRALELWVLIAAATFGVAIDSLLTLAGVFAFDPAPGVLPVPFWLVLLWLGFAATLRHALRFLMTRLPLAMLLGAIGGPLSYLAAARFGAVDFPFETMYTAGILAVCWAIEMFVLVWVVRLIERRAGSVERLVETSD